MRASYTKSINFLKLEIRKDKVDKGMISNNFSKLENLISEIKLLGDSILDFMTEDIKFDAEAMSKETEEIESYSDSFITIKRKVNDILNANKLSNSGIIENGNVNCKNKRYKLPKLNIKPFDSQLINYLSF